MGSHSSTDVRGPHLPTDIGIGACHVTGHLERRWGKVFVRCLNNRVLKEVQSTMLHSEGSETIKDANPLIMFHLQKS